MNEAITSFPFCSRGLVPGIFSRALEIDSVDEKATTGEEKIFFAQNPCDNRSMQG